MSEMMRAWQVRAWGGPHDMTLEDAVLRPAPGEGQALVRVEVAALNFFDGLMIAGKYQTKPEFPFVPGCELSGEVVEAGPGSDFKPGDRVAGQVPWGAFAEYALADNQRMSRIPDGVSWEAAAVTPCVYGTAHMALDRRGNMRKGDRVLITAAAGGVGLAAVQLAKTWGGEVFALAGSEEKLQVARENGADHALNYRDEGWVEQIQSLTGGEGVDVIVDPVGGEVYDKSLKVLGWEGRAVIIGFTSGTIQKIAANRLLLKNASAVGAVWGGYFRKDPKLAHAILDDCFKLLADGRIKPVISAHHTLETVPAALDALADRKTVGKLSVRIGPNANS